MESVSEIIKIRDNGTLYVETSDFLNLSSVKTQIDKLMKSSIYKSLLEKRTESNEPKKK